VRGPLSENHALVRAAMMTSKDVVSLVGDISKNLLAATFGVYLFWSGFRLIGSSVDGLVVVNGSSSSVAFASCSVLW
jgi:hypothetical protein